MRKIKQIFEILVIFSVGLLHLNLMSCGFFDDGIKDTAEKEQISAIRLSSSKVSVQVAGISYLSFTTTPQSSIKPEWKYDSSIIEIEEQANGIIIKGVTEGETAITCTYQNRSATAIVTVSGYAENYVDTTEPYIYSDTTVMQMGINDAETIHVSLYKGTVADIDGYTWTIENPAVASINPTGQYCTISSLSQGYSRIKVTHSKAPYPYYIGVYVLEDITKVTFITTKNNIVKLNTNDGEKSISVSLKNPKSENYQKDFSWQITEGEEYLSIISNNENCVMTPKSTGTAYVRITHPEADYPLDITVRIVEIVENVYIEPTTTTLTLSGSGINTDTITAKLVGISEGKDYSNDDFYFEVEQEKDSFGIGKFVDYQSFANQITFTGKHNGSAVLYIGHPSSAKKRQVLIITENQTADAVDASCMLTTTQNYIKTKVGAEETKVIVLLKGGQEEDSQKFQWNVKQQPKDGNSDVIELVKADGTVIDSRAADMTYTSGTAYIKPRSVGSATITVTNTKSYYPLEILVNVLDENAVLEEQYYFTGEGIVKFLNSESYDYTAKLRSAPENIKNKITWESDSPSLVINANGEKAHLSSTATGSVVSHITISHPSAQAPKEVLVLNADTQEELNSMKAFYSNKTYYSVNVDSEVSIFASQVGFTDENRDEFDFSKVASQVQWTSSEPSIASVERSQDSPLTGIVLGKKAGSTKITLSYNSISATFTVTVYPKNVVIGEVEKTIYLTTTQNVIILDGPGKTQNTNITAIGLESSKCHDILWESQNNNIATVISNGTKATITAVNEGETELHISHPDSENMLKIHIRVGSEFIGNENSAVPYINSVNMLTVLIGAAPTKLTAQLANYSGTDTNGFSFRTEDENIAKVSSQSSNGTAYIAGIASGSTEITVSHKATSVIKKVLIIVGKTQEEIDAILAQSVYLSTKKNTLSFEVPGKTENVSISAINLEESKYSDIVWSSSDESVAQVIPNGISATIRSTGNGKTTVTASYPGSLNTIEFYVFVGSEFVIHSNSVTYISASTDAIAILKDSPTYTLSAVLVNPENKNIGLSGFSFSIDDSSVANIISQQENGICYVKPVRAGQAEITITHPKSEYPKKVLVVIGNTLEELSEFKYLSTTTNVVNIGEGTTRSVSVTLENTTETVVGGFSWRSADASVASVAQTTSGTALISGNKIGTTKITVSHEQSKFSLDIIIQVIDPVAAAAMPFIQVPNPILNLVESTTWSTVTAELVGGNKSDAADFTWQIYDGVDIVELYAQNGIGKIRAKKAGIATLRVSHPKAAYPQDIRVICDAKASTEYSIGVSSGNILSIRPDAGDQIITATLANGSTADKYNFRWSLDVFDVIDMTYSANTAILTPLKEGTATLTVSHPKSAYDQKIVIKVQQYNTFGFSSVSKTVTAGQSTFITMEVPVSSEKTKVAYYSEKPNVVDIDGTAAVCQITGKTSETATVHAQLISERTGTVLATADMLVIVTPAPENYTYINGTAGLATTFTMTLGTSKVLTAEVVGDGITMAEQSNLVWSVDTKQSVLKLANSAAGKVAGSSAYVMAEKAGETTLTITHPKTSYTLVYHIIVPGAETVEVMLDKSYVSIEKGKNTTVKATVSTKKNSDYKLLKWTISRPNGDEIATVNGNGQTVTILALKAGTAYLTCSYPGNGTSAECQITITDPKSLMIDKNVIKLQPNSSKTFDYIVSPYDASINWVSSSNADGSDIFQAKDNGHDSTGKGTVTVTSFGNTGIGTLSGVSSYGPKASIQVQVSWDYAFSVGENEGSSFTIEPNKKKVFKYAISPETAKIEMSSDDKDKFHYELDSKDHTITITPIVETSKPITMTLSAINPNAPVGKQEFATKSFSMDFAYPKINTTVSFEGSNGNYSKLSNNVLHISDGEKVNLTFGIKEENADAYIEKVEFIPGKTQTNYAFNTFDVDASGGFVIADKSDDYIESTPYYKINKLFRPIKDGEIFNWKKVWWKGWSKGDQDDWVALYITKTDSKLLPCYLDGTNFDPLVVASWYDEDDGDNLEELRWNPAYEYDVDESYTGSMMTIEEFQSYSWLWFPGTPLKDWDTWFCEQDFRDGRFTQGSYGDGHCVDVEAHVITHNVDAELVDIPSTNTNPIQQDSVGKLVVTVNHRGKSEKLKNYEISVYYEVRPCSKDYKEK